jgi:hypothetical protein
VGRRDAALELQGCTRASAEGIRKCGALEAEQPKGPSRSG